MFFIREDKMEKNNKSNIGYEDVLNKRIQISEAINNPSDNLISIIGPCPLVNEPETIHREANIKSKLEDDLNNLVVLDRQCFTKPRTNPADWQGLDSSDPDSAKTIVSDLAKKYHNVSAEVRFEHNLERYADNLAMVWTGARNIADLKLIKLLAEYDHSLPIGIKNGLDGEIDAALEHVNYINSSRPHGSAPAVLIYRGGENATNLKSSAEMYKKAYDATNGRVIRDNAHGLEMAHNPSKEFKKSVEGQLRASHAAIHLAHQGYPALGVMYEASELESIMDPHMPLETAILHTELLHQVKLGQTVVKRFVSFKNLPSHGFGSKTQRV